MAKQEVTPMMRQFNEIKERYPDAILLFRCGDFYETYCADAIRASEILQHRASNAIFSSQIIVFLSSIINFVQLYQY